MALFKIEKGLAAALEANRPNTIEGYCYVTTDDGKFYIDTATAEGTDSRIVLNAGTADRTKGTLIIQSNGETVGTFNGEDSVINIEAGLTEPLILTEDISYGTTLPSSGEEGQLFFLEDTGSLLPEGGLTGQTLIKQSEEDGDVIWGYSVPEGGTLGQVLTKQSENNNDIIWADIQGLPEGGTAGQVLVKNSSTEGDASWGEIVALPSGGTAGQYLKKNSGTDGDAVWSSITPASIGAATTAALNNYLPLTGGTVTGNITINNDNANINKSVSNVMYWTGRDKAIVKQTTAGAGYYPTISMQTTEGSYEIGPYQGNLRFVYVSNTTYAGQNNQVEGGTLTTKIYMTPEGNIYGNKVYGAVYNDYAEYRELREDIEIPYGRVVIENGDDTLSLSTKRLQGGGNICSDTFGFAIGETDKAKMPIAVSGRALVYPYEDRNTYEPSDAVCTGPEGTVSKMTREEIKEYPDRIIGYVSAVPAYETWGENNVAVNGRIWIKVV